MFFKDLLNNYLRELNCTSKELSIESNISEAVIVDIAVVKEFLKKTVYK